MAIRESLEFINSEIKLLMSMFKAICSIICCYAPSGDKGNKLIGLALVLMVTGCKEKFVSPAPAIVTGYLVVEGVINNEGGLTNIKLSRTTSLNDNNNLPEKGAIVRIADSSNNTMELLESSAGNYTIDNLHLDATKKYRLSIKTSNNEEYLSDFAAIRNNPPIDSVNWVRENNGVQLYINTHDPQNNTHYYQWEYNETWEFHSAFSANLKYIKNNYVIVDVVNRDASDPPIFICWQSNASSLLLLGSSAKLSQDIIHLPLTNIPNASWKLSVLYSILVKQYSWTKEGYEFLEKMKKNTESVGSVFDAQPSELKGNIHCTTNPNQPVIGFFNICTVREKRIFIYSAEVPGWDYRSGCSEVVIENQRDSLSKKANGTLPTGILKGGPFGSVVTFYASKEECVDCTLRGTNVKPTYWP
jgi:Domain of unknown function (DUF4249)